MTGESSVGGITGFLRLDADQFHREIELALAEVKALEATDAKVRIDTSGVDRVASSTRKAAAGMDDSAASARRLEDATDRVRVAELKLFETETTANSKASSMLSARQALAKAQRDEQDAIFGTYAANVAYTASEDAAAEAIGREDKAHSSAAKSAREHESSVSGLVTTLVAVGPAIIPLSAAAIGVGAAFAGMASAGVLAVVGIKQAMAAGTATGRAYSAEISGLRSDVSSLAAVAASGVLGPFSEVVREMHSQMPGLTSDVHTFSGMLGNTAVSSVHGLLAAWDALQPLLDRGGVALVQLSRAADGFAQSQGFHSFVSYATAELPQVVGMVGQLVPAVVRLVSAFSPMGSTAVSALTALAAAINAVPISTLQTLATVGTSVLIAFKAWSALSGGVDKLGSSLSSLGAKLGVARAEAIATGTAMSVLNVATAGVAAVLGIAVAAWTIHEQKVQANRQAVEGYTQALISSNGAMDESVRQNVASQQVSSGALTLARQLGVAQGTVTDAVMGQGDAYASLTRQLQATITAHTQMSTAAKGEATTLDSQGAAAKKLLGILQQQNSQFAAGVQGQKDYAAATETGTASQTGYTMAQLATAAALGINAASLAVASDAQSKNQQQAQAATAQMQLENSAASLLKQSLDALDGTALSAAQAQNSFQQALLGVKSSAHSGGTAVKGNTSAAISNRSALLQAVSAAEASAEAYGDQKKSSQAARDKLAVLKSEIIQNATANGMNKNAVKAFIDQVLKVPKSVPPTKVDADTSAAKAKLDALTRTRYAIIIARTVAANQASAKHSDIASAHANGSLTLAHGVRAMATGGSTGRGAMLMRYRKPILWNEAPGGEAYIPLAPEKRARSTRILAATADAMGMQVSPKGSQPQAATGPSDLSNATIQKIVAGIGAAFPRTVTVSAGTVDRALGR